MVESEWDLSDNYGDISHANCLSKKVPNFLNPSLRKLVHECGMWRVREEEGGRYFHCQLSIYFINIIIIC